MFCVGVVASLLAAAPTRAETAPEDHLVGWVEQLAGATPTAADQFDGSISNVVGKAADAVEQWAAHLAWNRQTPSPDRALATARYLLETKRHTDGLLDSLLELRGGFVGMAAEQRREAINDFLRTTHALSELSGRLQYLLIDALHVARSQLPSDRRYNELLQLADEYDSPMVCGVLAADLLPPAEGDAPPTANLLPDANRDAAQRRLLELIARTRHQALLPQLARLLQQTDSPELLVTAAETIRAVGMPQEPHPQPRETLPPAAMTPRRMLATLQRIAPSRLSGDVASRHAELVAWLTALSREGLSEPRYRVGRLELAPGDWLLMRNPSPYNLFSDLSPGLFTHVGVVALETCSDGLRRMVIVDLPERGAVMPSTNVEIYLERTLNYAFLRHPDPAVARAMGQAARDVIGNEARFDLNFRTDRVLPLRGVPLKGQVVHTYCAGLLLLCAIQSDAPREEFFPIAEYPAAGHTLANFARLGLSVGNDMITPTGALFSPRLQLVGRNEALYDPRREVEEAVFDYFAQAMASKTLTPAPDLYQSLREKLAEAARDNRLLAQALATANRVNSQIDLVAAARAAAVVETLDEIAYRRSGEFLDARDALLAGPEQELAAEGFTAEELAAIGEYRRRHAELYAALQAGQLSPRQLRIDLVNYYAAAGRDDLDRRFFLAGDASR